MSPGHLLGIDLGTSGVKALVLPTEGGVPATAVADLPLDTPHPGWSEQEPGWWLDAAIVAIRTVLERSGVGPESIDAVAVSGQMHGAVLLDGAGDVLRPCILWNDVRSGSQCRAITNQVGLRTLVQWVGNPALAGFTAPKLLWVREHEPSIYSRLATVLLPKDYLNFKLTGERVTEVSDASGTLLFDVARRRWSEDMLHALDVPSGILPQVHESTTVIGRITREAAQMTGLREGTPVVAGGADNACAAIGVGVVAPGTVMVSLGTSGTVVSPSAAPLRDPLARLHSFCHAVPDTWYVMGVVLSAGGSLRWYRDILGRDAVREAESHDRDPYEVLIEMASHAPPGSEGLVFLPYLTGERTPHGDPEARGAFVGLSLRHGQPHLARSVIEGITFALGDSADLMRELKLRVDTIRVTGGGARSALWRQIVANVLNARVARTGIEEGPAYGAAMLAGVGVGVYPHVQAATELLVRQRDEIEPEAALVPEYQQYHDLYDRLYPALRDIFADTAHLLEQNPTG